MPTPEVRTQSLGKAKASKGKAKASTGKAKAPKVKAEKKPSKKEREASGLLSDAELKSKLAAKSASMMKMAKRAEIAATLEELTRDGANSQFVNQNDESPTAR